MVVPPSGTPGKVRKWPKSSTFANFFLPFWYHDGQKCHFPYQTTPEKCHFGPKTRKSDIFANFFLRKSDIFARFFCGFFHFWTPNWPIYSGFIWETPPKRRVGPLNYSGFTWETPPKRRVGPLNYSEFIWGNPPKKGVCPLGNPPKKAGRPTKL